MSDKLPDEKFRWKRAASRNKIGHTDSLLAGAALASGSKFTFEHFLRLRVLYIEQPNLSKLLESPGFTEARVKEVKNIIGASKEAAFLESFLKDSKSIDSGWSANAADKSGKLGVVLEKLHNIARRGLRSMKDSEDISDHKIVGSPIKTRSMIQSGARCQQSPHSITDAPTTPTKSYGSLASFDLASPDDFSLSNLSIESSEDVISQPGTDLRQVMYDFEHSDFTPGDERTVNAALVELMMVLSWLLGHTGRVRYGACFSIPKDIKTHLYSAYVDGLIMHLKEDKLNGFMEVKRDFRAKNQSVRRQIAAQMSAFIYEQDVVLAQKKSQITVKER